MLIAETMGAIVLPAFYKRVKAAVKVKPISPFRDHMVLPYCIIFREKENLPSPQWMAALHYKPTHICILTDM